MEIIYFMGNVKYSVEKYALLVENDGRYREIYEHRIW